MSKPCAIVVGFIGKLPYAGMSLYNLHHIVGLQQLGYEVHYVERQNCREECYDPGADAMTDDPSAALGYLHTLLPRFGIGSEQFSFIDRLNCCHGSGWAALCVALDSADFVLNLEDPTWFDELERCPRRAFVEGDPMFTQVDMMNGESVTAQALAHYPTLFTYGARLGMADCTLPAAGRQWIPARPAVATSLWEVTPAASNLPITALMHWAAGNDPVCDGKTYGHKSREFERFIDLPLRCSEAFVLAVGGRAPRERLAAHGWRLADPLAATRTLEAYQEFIAGSWADLGIAKHAYVASRSGWFSDRSTCYLAAGRPVLHQDTGFGDWLPAGDGVLAFSGMEDLLEALERLRMDYPGHAQAARRIAEEHFEAGPVLARMLAAAGFA